MAGFIKLYRSMLEWEWYGDINVKILFLHLLLKSNYEPKKWQGIEIERGQFVTSIKNLSSEVGLSEKQIRNALNKLKITGEIEIKTTNKYTLINVVNFNKFQDISFDEGNQKAIKGQSKDNQEADKRQSKDNQRATTKEREEIKENKEYKEREEIKNIYQLIADMYNKTCVSFPKCTKLSEARKTALKARLKKFTVEDFKLMFEKAEQSDFLKGANNRNWIANFDWFISDKNFVKVIDGNYDNNISCVSNSCISNVSQKNSSSSNVFLDIAKEEGLF